MSAERRIVPFRSPSIPYFFALLYLLALGADRRRGTDYEVASWKWAPHTTLKKLDFASGEMRLFAEVERKKGAEPRIRWVRGAAGTVAENQTATARNGNGVQEEPWLPASDFLSTDSPFSLYVLAAVLEWSGVG